jgi:hypothetical protein
MNADKVDVTPDVLRLMVSHATSHSTSSVHGVLVGQADGKVLKVTDAYPICHETPTKVLVETSLALVQSSLEEKKSSNTIVGWYTAPELLGETKPSPVALRVAAALESHSNLHPVLLVLNNQAIVTGASGADMVAAFGKDFGNQWMEPLPCTTSVVSALEPANSVSPVHDLVDHWNNGVSTAWTTATAN